MITVKRLDTAGDVYGEAITDALVGKNIPAMIATAQASLGDGYGLQSVQLTVPYQSLFVGDLLKIVDSTQGRPYMAMITSISIECSGGKSTLQLTVLKRQG